MDDNFLPPSSPPAESPPDTPRNAPRTLLHPTNHQQGTAFHELIVAPTYMPQHTQPYWDHFGQRFIDPMAPYQSGPAPAPATAAAVGPAAGPGPATGAGWVSVNAIVIRIEYEAPTGRRGQPKAKSVEDPRITTEKGNVGVMARQDFLDFALKPHGRDGVYCAQDTGPEFKVYWQGAGSIGSKKTAPTIRDESSWIAVRDQLVAVLGRSKNLNSIYALFDLAAMEPFKSQKRALSVERLDNVELTFGTRVPNMAYVSDDDAATAAKMQEILAAHPCAEHQAACFILESGKHVTLNRFRVRPWAKACLLFLATPDAPPLEILREWDETMPVIPTGRISKPRGRTGTPLTVAEPSGSFDAAMAAVAATAQLATAMMAKFGQQGDAAAPRVAAAPSPPPARSSPPPSIADELDDFVAGLRTARNLTPDLLTERNSRLTDARLMEMTGLNEGQVMQMRDYAERWANRIQGKRTRRKIDF
ncbi:hypothetical protein MKEN_00219100 [Mycena kentingensis (nom. inval.)]|nr:hypothetical protein MKEN_00219100 [Mycena kentingensis (nom. inval.)]